MSQEQFLKAEMLVGEVLSRWPATAEVFTHYKTACVGCAFAPFCSLAYAAESYGISQIELLFVLEQKIQSDLSGTGRNEI